MRTLWLAPDITPIHGTAVSHHAWAKLRIGVINQHLWRYYGARPDFGRPRMAKGLVSQIETIVPSATQDRFAVSYSKRQTMHSGLVSHADMDMDMDMARSQLRHFQN